jgi:ABC-type polysaccharide/polyol phosphate export permease
MVDLAVGAIVLIGMMIFYRVPVGPALLFLPVLLLIQTLFTAGIALIISMANLFLRDVKYIFDMVLSLWMFATSVVFPIALVGGKLGQVLMLNPMTPIIEAYRDVIIFGRLPPFGPLAIATALAVVTMAIGWLIFHRAEYRFAEAA